MQNAENKFGFTRFSELWNGRLATIGFVAAMAVEYFTGQGILGQLGIIRNYVVRLVQYIM